MLAVMGLDAGAVAAACAGVDGPVAPANLNSPVQTVIAGAREAVREAGEACKAAGAKRVVSLPVSAPFHCELMRPAADRLAPELEAAAFAELGRPVVSNVSARPYTAAADARRLLHEQVCSPVRWVDCVGELAAAGASSHLEVGPGKVLSGLAARIERRLTRANVETLEDVEPALATLAEALA